MARELTMVSFIVGLVLVLTGGTAALGDPIQWDTAAGGNGHWYEIVVDTDVSWSDAQANAEAAGGDLASIHSQCEQDFIESILDIQATITGGYWIGFNDEAEEANWIWTSSEPTTYTNWCTGEPNGSRGENCAHVLWTVTPSEVNYYRRGLWNDMREQGRSDSDPDTDINRGGYIVEIVPEPTTLGLLAICGLGLMRTKRRR